jgi:hypothetical protein
MNANVQELQELFGSMGKRQSIQTLQLRGKGRKTLGFRRKKVPSSLVFENKRIMAQA